MISSSKDFELLLTQDIKSIIYQYLGGSIWNTSYLSYHILKMH